MNDVQQLHSSHASTNCMNLSPSNATETTKTVAAMWCKDPCCSVDGELRLCNPEYVGVGYKTGLIRWSGLGEWNQEMKNQEEGKDRLGGVRGESIDNDTSGWCQS